MRWKRTFGERRRTESPDAAQHPHQRGEREPVERVPRRTRHRPEPALAVSVRALGERDRTRRRTREREPERGVVVVADEVVLQRARGREEIDPPAAERAYGEEPAAGAAQNRE